MAPNPQWTSLEISRSKPLNLSDIYTIRSVPRRARRRYRRIADNGCKRVPPTRADSSQRRGRCSISENALESIFNSLDRDRSGAADSMVSEDLTEPQQQKMQTPFVEMICVTDWAHVYGTLNGPIFGFAYRLTISQERRLVNLGRRNSTS
ncbi:hypothetical protein EVAR_82195_1 [Eumeta japonica]|uniref:Uncharacterized protein n=1 Tax=Eumeta variegata TaxID=151549 RepID=A0A4C1W7V2_EUMVA|nr:hypothetical protein EVAR_82195_1 [Eumeta japonica]